MHDFHCQSGTGVDTGTQCKNRSLKWLVLDGTCTLRVRNIVPADHDGPAAMLPLLTSTTMLLGSTPPLRDASRDDSADVATADEACEAKLALDVIIHSVPDDLVCPLRILSSRVRPPFHPSSSPIELQCTCRVPLLLHTLLTPTQCDQCYGYKKKRPYIVGSILHYQYRDDSTFKAM